MKSIVPLDPVLVGEISDFFYSGCGYDFLSSAAHKHYQMREYATAKKFYEWALSRIDFNNLNEVAKIPASIVLGLAMSSLYVGDLSQAEEFLRMGSAMPRDKFCDVLFAGDILPGLDDGEISAAVAKADDIFPF